MAESDKAAAYVDLGRAYEKNEDLDRAIESYVKATQLDPQSAAAFLRAGILHGRRQQLSKANDAFSKAEDIYRAMSSQEGLAEVHYQRGSLLARLRRLPEAKAQLEQSLTMSRASSSEYQAIRTSLQLSNVYYATGDSTRAEAIAADAVKAAQVLNSRTLATNGLIDLGYTLLARGEFAAHARVLAPGARSGPPGQVASPGSSGPPRAWQSRYAGGHLRRSGVSPRGGAEVLPAGGLPHRDIQRPDPAWARLLRQGRVRRRDEGIHRAAGIGEAVRRPGSTGGGAFQHRRPSWRPPGAVRRGPPLFRGELSHQQVARRARQHGMGPGQSGGVAGGVGKVRRSRGRSHRSPCHCRRADAQFKSQLAYVEVIGAQMALSLGDRVQARTRATAALSLAEPDYKDTALQARQTLALTQAGTGAPKTAVTLVEDVVGAARELKVPRLLSTALLASAEVRLAGGDGRGALADAQAAQRLFAAAEQLESEWRAWLVSARAMRLEGDSSVAHDYAVRAETSRAALQARWGDDNYRGYARRPDIHGRLKELAQLLERTRSVNARKESWTWQLNKAIPAAVRAEAARRNPPRRRRRRPRRRSSAIAGSKDPSAGYLRVLVP